VDVVSTTTAPGSDHPVGYFMILLNNSIIVTSPPKIEASLGFS
jgi:hypothetical protein